MCNRFSGQPDEVGFIMLHVDINRYSPNLVGTVMQTIQALHNGAESVGDLLEKNWLTMKQMNERRKEMWKASRWQRYNDFRIFIMGVKGNTDLFGEGVIYENVWDEPKAFRGQTGAQDDIIPMQDIFSGVIFYYPENDGVAHTIQDRKSLIDVIYSAIQEGSITAYGNAAMDDEFREEMSQDDIKKIQTNIGEFNTVIWGDSSFSYGKGNYTGKLVFETATNGISKAVTVENVFLPFSTNTLIVDNNAFKRQYMIVSEDVLDEKKYQTFKDALISNVQGNKALIGDGADNIDSVFDAYWISQAKPVFAEENSITKAFIDNLEKTKLKDFLKYTPFDKKERVLTYTIENGASNDKKKAQENMIKGLGATTNSNTNNNTWNNENGATGAYTSKAKLN